MNENKWMEYLTLTDLASLFAQYGSGPLLSSTQTLIALVKSDGTLLEGNPAFNRLKESLSPTAVLHDLLSSSSRPLFNKILNTVSRGQNAGRGKLEFITGNQH